MTAPDRAALIKRITCARWKAEAEVTRIKAERDALTVEFRKVEVLWKEAAIDASRIEAERDAMREPTEEMIVAGVKTLLTGHDSQRHYVAALWRRMFDAAKEKP